MSIEREPLVTHMFTADPSAHVFDGKIYIYPSHDIPHNGEDNDNGDEYQMRDYHVLSMESLDSECVDNGLALSEKDVPWVSEQMWAPDAAYKNGKYYLYFPARDKEGNFRLGVAESDSPVGPFTPDDNYIPGSYSIDPAVMVEGDEAYIYYGGLWGGQLEKWQTGEFVPDAVGPSGDEPALGPMFAVLSEDMKSFKSTPQMLRILDENGEPIKAGDEERRYFEAPWLHKYNGKYYLSYSTGTTHYIVYATSDSPVGPFTYGGRIMEPVIGWTTHHSIVEIGGKWYLFYHDCEMSGGINHRRTVKFTELKYNEDGSIVTIQPYDHK
ncbi:glycoside hydrolase family 43 protein [Lacrimispora saccharolytica]|uniref:glycoside hydrolase family 43 protein n=1 Tax=Lacrimispora saccharolytica TaxID=84030 RepID=UPI001B782386|nr:glycoside hydrolase family 43 protein [Lacrimispora saccharolytica]MBP9000746.1 glycoside hydrolase family 43 protein [Lachnospiraceae bacterium]MBS7329925.1 glycoside hydrolase family 43 protein [Lachnospiraceae bacterium]MCF2656528.1 glycoside hydrolase family 43 protein [Lacrimispora saccharolytica]MCI7557934.1 glycoside hydrolase family 43 protein [Lachnospiraceae bacterium]MDD7548350.1 glycoside hydrolase family 43 protein [Lachnospiraceae bacterium]